MDSKTTGGIALIIGILTECIMRVTPKSFDKKRFAFPISVGLGIIILVATGLANGNTSVVTMVLNGIIAGAAASGGFDGIKTIQAHVNGKGGGVNGQ